MPQSYFSECTVVKNKASCFTVTIEQVNDKLEKKTTP